MRDKFQLIRHLGRVSCLDLNLSYVLSIGTYCGKFLDQISIRHNQMNLSDIEMNKTQRVCPKSPFKQENPTRSIHFSRRVSLFQDLLFEALPLMREEKVVTHFIDREIHSLSEGVSEPPRSSFALGGSFLAFPAGVSPISRSSQ
jgi:hypothetical protein